MYLRGHTYKGERGGEGKDEEKKKGAERKKREKSRRRKGMGGRGSPPNI